MSALRNIKVLDLSRILAGPYSTQILADLGAEIWKVESPWGDDTRQWGPPFLNKESSYYLSANRGKKSLIINLKSEKGQNIIKDLAKKADILVENFKVGNLAKFGLDYKSLSEINPKLIYASVTGFGQTGPRSSEPGYDAALQGMTGIMSVTGEPDGKPTKVGVAWIDILTGLNATIGILGALNERNTSGLGQHIDVSLFDVGIASMGYLAQNYLATGVSATRIGNAHPQVAPYQDFEASNGNFIAAANNDDQFHRLCNTIGLPELLKDDRFESNSKRVSNRIVLAEKLNSVFKANTIDYWTDKLQSAGITITPINDIGTVLEDPQTAARNSIWSINHPDIQDLKVIGSPLQHMSRTPSEPGIHPPRLGEHTFDVMENILGMSKIEINELVESNVIQGMS
ncbi:MAG: CoA transferase [Chloroflexi bacterium]|nr:CoA transferase [Chloroflexota bacterium]